MPRGPRSDRNCRPVFSNDEPAAAALLTAAGHTHDPLWRMPLWHPYRKLLDSKIANISNSSDSSYAGAITAALYLQEFVEGGCAVDPHRYFRVEQCITARPARGW